MRETARRILLLFLGDPASDRRVQNFGRFFKEEGYRVELIAGVSNSSSEADFTPLIVRRGRGPRRFREYHQKLSKVLSTRAADIVIACDLYSLRAASRFKNRGKAKLLVYDAREVYTELPTVSNRPLHKTIWKGVERRGLTESDLMLVTAPHDVQAICDVHQFVPRSVLVRNLPWKKEVKRQRELLEPFGIGHRDTVLVYVGGLQIARGLEIAIRSIPDGCKLLLIGDGSIRQELEKQVARSGKTEQVIFTGALPSEQAEKLVAASDVGLSLIEPVSKSYELALPSKIFEYLAAGIPIVSSRLTHVMELFPKQDGIQFVDVGNSESVREGMSAAISFAKDPAVREQMAAVSKDFHFAEDARQLSAVLNQML